MPHPPPLLLPQGSKKQRWVFGLWSHTCAVWSEAQECLPPRLRSYFSKHGSEGTKPPRATALPSISNLEDSWLSNSAAPRPFRLWRWPPEERHIAWTFLNPPYNVSKLLWIQQDLVEAFLGKPWVSVSQWQVGSHVMGVRKGTCLTISTGKD